VLDGHGTSPEGGCEGSPDPSEVSSPGKLSVFSQPPMGKLGTSFITDLRMLPHFEQERFLNSGGKEGGENPSLFCIYLNNSLLLTRR
jgi:hypothetical protein